MLGDAPNSPVRSIYGPWTVLELSSGRYAELDYVCRVGGYGSGEIGVGKTIRPWDAMQRRLSRSFFTKSHLV